MHSSHGTQTNAAANQVDEVKEKSGVPPSDNLQHFKYVAIWIYGS